MTDLTPDQLRHTLIKPHNCPELARCGNHPRWHVVRLIEPEGWSVSCPGNGHIATFATHAEAINHADREARK